jgi:hypothetical protein
MTLTQLITTLLENFHARGLRTIPHVLAVLYIFRNGPTRSSALAGALGQQPTFVNAMRDRSTGMWVQPEKNGPVDLSPSVREELEGLGL